MKEECDHYSLTPRTYKRLGLAVRRCGICHWMYFENMKDSSSEEKRKYSKREVKASPPVRGWARGLYL